MSRLDHDSTSQPARSACSPPNFQAKYLLFISLFFLSFELFISNLHPQNSCIPPPPTYPPLPVLPLGHCPHARGRNPSRRSRQRAWAKAAYFKNSGCFIMEPRPPDAGHLAHLSEGKCTNLPRKFCYLFPKKWSILTFGFRLGIH